MANNTTLLFEHPEGGIINFFFEYPNSLMSNHFGNFILISIFSIAFISSSLGGFEFEQSFAASSWICLVASVMLISLGILNTYAFAITVLMSLASLIILRG